MVPKDKPTYIDMQKAHGFPFQKRSGFLTSMLIYRIVFTCIYIYIWGFPKMGVPHLSSIHFNWILHSKPFILGYPKWFPYTYMYLYNIYILTYIHTNTCHVCVYIYNHIISYIYICITTCICWSWDHPPEAWSFSAHLSHAGVHRAKTAEEKLTGQVEVGTSMDNP